MSLCKSFQQYSDEQQKRIDAAKQNDDAAAKYRRFKLEEARHAILALHEEVTQDKNDNYLFRLKFNGLFVCLQVVGDYEYVRFCDDYPPERRFSVKISVFISSQHEGSITKPLCGHVDVTDLEPTLAKWLYEYSRSCCGVKSTQWIDPLRCHPEDDLT